MEKKTKKLCSPRLYYDDGYRKRVDCVLFRDINRNEVLLVSSRNHLGCWSIPGGGIEPNESSEFSAIREAQEEVMIMPLHHHFNALNRRYFN
jgi:diphosphoinositol-polyphosphate diphosphatase